MCVYMSGSCKVNRQKRTQVCLPPCISLLQSFSEGTPRIGMEEHRRGSVRGGSLTRRFACFY